MNHIFGLWRRLQSVVSTQYRPTLLRNHNYCATVSLSPQPQPVLPPVWSGETNKNFTREKSICDMARKSANGCELSMFGLVVSAFKVSSSSGIGSCNGDLPSWAERKPGLLYIFIYSLAANTYGSAVRTVPSSSRGVRL